MSALKEIRLKPLSELSVFEAYQIEVARALEVLRGEANIYKQHGFMCAVDRSALSYFYGQLVGICFAFAGLLIPRFAEYKAATEIRQAALNEANFLTGPYLAGITGATA